MSELTDGQRKALDRYAPLSINEFDGTAVNGGGYQCIFHFEIPNAIGLIEANLAAAIVHCVNEYPVLVRALRLSCEGIAADNPLTAEQEVDWFMAAARDQIGG